MVARQDVWVEEWLPRWFKKATQSRGQLGDESEKKIQLFLR
jgi:hypothetical protein